MVKFDNYESATKFIQLCEDVASIKTDVRTLKEIQPLVEKHERMYSIAKWASAPMLVALVAPINTGMRQLLQKLGF